MVSFETEEIIWRGLDGAERPAAGTRRCTSTKRQAWHCMACWNPMIIASAASRFQQLLLYTVDVNVDQYTGCALLDRRKTAGWNFHDSCSRLSSASNEYAHMTNIESFQIFTNIREYQNCQRISNLIFVGSCVHFKPTCTITVGLRFFEYR